MASENPAPQVSNGMMSITNIKLLCVSEFVQKCIININNRNRAFTLLCYRAVSQILTLGLNRLPVCDY
jgi:hypothetical protein